MNVITPVFLRPAFLIGVILTFANSGQIRGEDLIYTWKNNGNTSYGDAPPTQVYDFKMIDNDDEDLPSAADTAAGGKDSVQTAPLPSAEVKPKTVAAVPKPAVVGSDWCAAYQNNIQFLHANRDTPNSASLLEYYQSQLKNYCH